jgi:hypothetical protein
LVTWPDDVTRVSGKAKKARKASECPSSNKTLCEFDAAGEDVPGDDFVRGFLVAAIFLQSNQRIRSRQPRSFPPGGRNRLSSRGGAEAATKEETDISPRRREEHEGSSGVLRAPIVVCKSFTLNFHRPGGKSRHILTLNWRS